MGKRKRDGKILPQSEMIQASKGNEEIGHSAVDSKKTKIKDTKEPNNVHKNGLKVEILQVITENFMEMKGDMLN
jgi:hypothetical protein